MTFAQPFSDYKILERVGSGSMGTVFKAHHERLDRIVALKVLRPSLSRDQRYVARLRREARLVAALSHPNIVAGYDIGEEGGYHFFVMEFVEGQTLKQLLTEWGTFSETQVLDLAIQVASALDHAYRRGIIHRDIKPGNILIDDDNVIKVTDFGLAKGPLDATLTRDGATVGTPQYISPEQARDPQSADIRSDLYSLGATLFHMVAGLPPFAGSTMAEVLTKVLNERAPSVSEVNPAVGDGLSLVIRKLLAKDPKLRYQTPAELLDDLHRVERAEPPQVDERRLRLADRPARRVSWPLIAALAVALLVPTIATWWLGGGASSGDNEVESPLGQKLVSALDAAATMADKLRVLGEFRARAGPDDRVAVQVMQLALESELRTAIDEFFAGYGRGAGRRAAEQWFLTPANWREPARFEQWIAEQFAAAVGVPPAGLPVAVREHYGERRGQLSEMATGWQAQRDDEFARRFADYLAHDLRTAWLGPLESRDFAGARQALRAGLDDFFGREGRPTREQVPDDLGARLAAAETAAVAQASGAIRAEEERVAQELQRVVRRELEDLEKQFRQLRLRAGLVQESLDRLRDNLAQEYPPAAAFDPIHNPWPSVEAEIKGLENALAADLRLEEAAWLDSAVERAYALFVHTGRVGEALQWLAARPLRNLANRDISQRHQRLLRGAGAAAGRVRQQLLAGRPHALLPVRRALAVNAPPLQVEFDAGGTAFGLVREEGKVRPVSAAELYWPDLMRELGDGASATWPAAEQRDLTSGLALWYLVSGDDAGALALVGEEERAFFSQHVMVPVDRARKVRLDAGGGQGEFEPLRALQAAFGAEPRGLSAVSQALSAFDDDLGDLAADAQLLVRDARTWVAAETARRALEARLTADAQVGVEVTVALGGSVTAAARPGDFVGLPPGWARAGTELAYTRDDVDLAMVVAGDALAMEVALRSTQVEFELDLRLPALADHHRLYLFECDGALVCLGVLRNGAVGCLIGNAELAARGAELRRRLRPALARAADSDPAIIPGALHRLAVRVVGRRSRARVTVSLDGHELAQELVARPVPPSIVLRLLPLQPMQLAQVRLRAQAP